MKPTALPNTFLVEGRSPRFFTRSLAPGTTFFQENTRNEKGIEYRELDPRHSKLAAALARGCKEFGVSEGSVVLYLGASHGYTPSFMSDMVGKDGMLYCVEFSPPVARDLVFVCEARGNMLPILADANHPEVYASRITAADVVFQDIAQRDQVGIFVKNLRFLAPKGYGLLAVKARSVDSTKAPREIFKRVKAELASLKGFTLVADGTLDPYEKDHAFYVVRKS